MTTWREISIERIDEYIKNLMFGDCPVCKHIKENGYNCPNDILGKTNPPICPATNACSVFSKIIIKARNDLKVLKYKIDNGEVTFDRPITLKEFDEIIGDYF